MDRELSLSETRKHLPSLIDEVALHKAEIVITKRGKPLARLVPWLARPKSRKHPLRGMPLWTSDDFNESTEELWEALKD